MLAQINLAVRYDILRNALNLPDRSILISRKVAAAFVTLLFLSACGNSGPDPSDTFDAMKKAAKEKKADEFMKYLSADTPESTREKLKREFGKNDITTALVTGKLYKKEQHSKIQWVIAVQTKDGSFVAYTFVLEDGKFRLDVAKTRANSL